MLLQGKSIADVTNEDLRSLIGAASEGARLSSSEK
jgi:hypothetical protein